MAAKCRWCAMVGDRTEEKLGKPGSDLRSGVIRVCHKWKNEVPVCLIRSDMRREHVTQSTIKPLSQTVRLWVVGCTLPVYNMTLLKKCLDYIGEEYTPTVTEEFARRTMTKHKTIEDERCDVLCCRCGKSSSFSVPCKMVHSHDSPSVACRCQWQWSVEVDSNAVEWAVWAWKWLQ